MHRPYTTLFVLASVDGKISTGAVDSRDFDKDLKMINGIKKGLHQYYDLEKQTDRVSFNTGKVMAKIGVNTSANPIHCPGVTFVIVDNTHLTAEGIKNLSENLEKLIILTINKNHPAKSAKMGNVEVIEFDDVIDFNVAFDKLYSSFAVERMTIQSGGTMNSLLLRMGLIDELSVVYAPCMIGGTMTPTIVDGESLESDDDLTKITTLELMDCKVLENSYVNLKYRVNQTIS